ncbi:MAG: thioredoxin domain-containing protein, partial [Chloroflexota bacterium]|nr:thioredoxin domain-containing protein [Chloroflexota bacterium]
PWGAEAFERARADRKPIFLSIGYAACHWCHVMERESFEDEATAAKLNEKFVSIKVDREERPDLDAIYMDAVQAMTGQGGWPMSVFLTPEGKPFYGGTYFPSERRYGMPSFRDVLDGVSRAWQEDRAGVESTGSQLAQAIASEGRAADPGAAAPLGSSVLEAAMVALERSFDAAHGGWGGAPKFPQPMAIEFLLRHYVRTDDQRALAMARRTLDAMAAGGIYDHLGGGFARYSTDAHWLVPHFEKMLYDNAQLARVYLHAFQLTREPRYREVVEETLDFLLREMATEDGAFASSLDADTEGEEGRTYVWSADEIREVLADSSVLFEAAYGVTERGNWEGHNILSRVRDDAALGRDFALAPEEVAARLREARGKLLERRNSRPQPARDDKVLAAWNGLVLAPFAEASRVLARADYGAAASRAADVLLGSLRGPDGRLRRSWKDGRAAHNGVLEDYTHLAEGLLALYEATFDERWFIAARELMDRVIDRFADPAGGFFDTSDDHERLLTRPKGLQDNALPSGNAMAALVLLRLAALTADAQYREAAERALRLVVGVAARYPTGFGQWLIALDFAVGPVDEVAIVGDPSASQTIGLLDVVLVPYRPRQVVALAGDGTSSDVPLLHHRPTLAGQTTAYVCRNFACQRPVTDPAALASQLAA